jgi:hypothetical protein
MTSHVKRHAWPIDEFCVHIAPVMLGDGVYSGITSPPTHWWEWRRYRAPNT